MTSRNKSRYRSTTFNKQTGDAYTRYTDSLGQARSWAKSPFSWRTGTISKLNPKTNRFKKLKKFGW